MERCISYVENLKAHVRSDGLKRYGKKVWEVKGIANE